LVTDLFLEKLELEEAARIGQTSNELLAKTLARVSKRAGRGA
jgi:hypothetical protein